MVEVVIVDGKEREGRSPETEDGERIRRREE